MDSHLYIKAFKELLIANNDLDKLPLIVSNLQKELRSKKTVLVTSAQSLTESMKSLIQTELTQRLGDGFDIIYKVRPEIIGGIIIQIGDELVDNSVRSKLGSFVNF
jgi:F-type H+-transporting ATPase subunit delta